MSMATMQVLGVDILKDRADGCYSNAQAVARCERDNVEVAAPIIPRDGVEYALKCQILSTLRRCGR